MIYKTGSIAAQHAGQMKHVAAAAPAPTHGSHGGIVGRDGICGDDGI